MNMIEKVAKAIEIAGQHRPYGLYDYSNYPGETPPHVVRDEGTGERLFVSSDRNQAYEYWRKITQGYIAKAAIAAMREPSEGMVKEINPYDNDWVKRYWQPAIDVALKKE